MSREGVQEILQWKWNEKEALNFFEKIKATESFLKELDADGVRCLLCYPLLLPLFSILCPLLCVSPFSLLYPLLPANTAPG